MSTTQRCARTLKPGDQIDMGYFVRRVDSVRAYTLDADTVVGYDLAARQTVTLPAGTEVVHAVGDSVTADGEPFGGMRGWQRQYAAGDVLDLVDVRS